MSQIEFHFEPLWQWPYPQTHNRGPGPFRATLSNTYELLRRELKMLNATGVVIQADCPPAMIRRDGLFRADARVGPRIILSFSSKHGPQSFPCDRYQYWDQNIRAIALSLEALRSVDRYGVTRQGEQYRGWQALPSPNHSIEKEIPTPTEALLWLRRKGYSQHATCVADHIRAAELATHPDRGGNVDDFKRVQRCRELLL